MCNTVYRVNIYLHSPTPSKAAGIHSLVHALPAKQMIHLLVLHVIGASESVLMAHLFLTHVALVCPSSTSNLHKKHMFWLAYTSLIIEKLGLR